MYILPKVAIDQFSENQETKPGYLAIVISLLGADAPPYSDSQIPDLVPDDKLLKSRATAIEVVFTPWQREIRCCNFEIGIRVQ